MPSTACRSRARRNPSRACGGTIAWTIFTRTAPPPADGVTLRPRCARREGVLPTLPPVPSSAAPVVLLLGGRSEIGVALACRLAATGRAGTVVLAARRADDLAREVAAVRAAGAEVA